MWLDPLIPDKNTIVLKVPYFTKAVIEESCCFSAYLVFPLFEDFSAEAQPQAMLHGE